MCDYINTLGKKCNRKSIGHFHASYYPIYYCKKHERKLRKKIM